jgi:hypothetical protein
MAVAFMRGTTTGPNDLMIIVRDPSNNPINPYRLEYAVYDFSTGLEILMGSPVNAPIQMTVGNFYAQVVIPADAHIGLWRIRWTVQEYSTEPVYQSVQEFQVIADNTITSFTGDPNLDKLLYSLRIMLRDNNPDRNYRFRPPENEKFIQGQTQVFGFIWEDEELLEYLYMAVDDFNSRPPVTGINIDNLWSGERRWRTTILIRAASFACFAIAMTWIANEFSIDGKELITVQDKDGNEYSLTARELFDMMYGDKLQEITDKAKKEIMESIQELKNEDVKEGIRN